jgi:hypothetical protein
MGVRRKATIIGILAVLLTAATAGESRVYGRVLTSMRSIQRNFGDLKKADSMSTIERFVFSLVLSNSKPPASAADTYPPSAGRT